MCLPFRQGEASVEDDSQRQEGRVSLTKRRSKSRQKGLKKPRITDMANYIVISVSVLCTWMCRQLSVRCLHRGWRLASLPVESGQPLSSRHSSHSAPPTRWHLNQADEILVECSSYRHNKFSQWSQTRLDRQLGNAPHPAAAGAASEF